MRIVSATFWGFLGAIFGAVDGAAFGWLLSWPLLQSALAGAVLGGGSVFIYRFLTSGQPLIVGLPAEKARYVFRGCAWCKGSGTEAKTNQPCQVCNKAGRVLTEPQVKKCSKCKGKGRILMGRRCPRCKGAGWDHYALIETGTI